LRERHLLFRSSPGIPDVAYCLGLQQVELSVEHRSSREFARLGGSRSGGYKRRCNQRWRDQPTMTRDLNGVFTGERGWSAVEDNNPFVEPITRRIRDLGKCGLSRFLGPGMDEATPDFERAWS